MVENVRRYTQKLHPNWSFKQQTPQKQKKQTLEFAIERMVRPLLNKLFLQNSQFEKERSLKEWHNRVQQQLTSKFNQQEVLNQQDINKKFFLNELFKAIALFLAIHFNLEYQRQIELNQKLLNKKKLLFRRYLRKLKAMLHRRYHREAEIEEEKLKATLQNEAELHKNKSSLKEKPHVHYLMLYPRYSEGISSKAPIDKIDNTSTQRIQQNF